MSLAGTELLADAVPPRRRVEQPDETPRRQRRLRLLDRPLARHRPHTVYGVVALLGVVVIVGAQIALSMLTTQDSYQVADLMQQRRDLTLQEQQLSDAVAGLESPQYLAANAADLGMVIDGAPNFLRLSDGTVTGTGETSTWNSTVNMKKSQVANALIADTPLATDPGRSTEGSIADEKTEDADKASSEGKKTNEKTDGDEPPAGPPSIDDGLPSPETH